MMYLWNSGRAVNCSDWPRAFTVFFVLLIVVLVFMVFFLCSVRLVRRLRKRETASRGGQWKDSSEGRHARPPG